MIYSNKLQQAISFAIKVHQLDQNQTRKGKKDPYIVHPLSLGIILAKAGANEDTIIAGILHDTIEDSIPEKKVTKEMLKQPFGETVANLVDSITEPNKELPWKERKHEALSRVQTFTHDSLLVKSADIISNLSELVDDHKKDGDKMFERFNGPKEQMLKHQLETIGAIISRWNENPLREDLLRLARDIQQIGAFDFMQHYPSDKLEYQDYDKDMPIACSLCNWKGTPKESGWIEYYDDLMDVSCPWCEKMLLVVSYPRA